VQGTPRRDAIITVAATYVISTLSIYLLADSLHPLPLYKGERR